MSEQEKILIAMTTCPAAPIADRIAQTLVGEGFAACVNQISGITSTYIWQEQVQTDTETLLLIKTTKGQFESLKTRLAAIHPYELPELVAIPVCAGAETYLNWIRDTVKRPTL